MKYIQKIDDNSLKSTVNSQMSNLPAIFFYLSCFGILYEFLLACIANYSLKSF